MSGGVGNLRPMLITADAIHPVPRILGWYDVAVRVRYEPTDGGAGREVVGAYVDAHEPEGPVFLGDGVEMLFSDLGLAFPELDALLALCDAVTAGLADSGTTTVPMTGGALTVTLVPWQEAPERA